MNIQIYVNKKNPDVLKAERFFKERRIPYQLVDLKKQGLSISQINRLTGFSRTIISRARAQ